MSRDKAMMARLLRRARTVAVVGGSPGWNRHSRMVTRYLHQAGYDVVPVRSDQQEVAGLPTYARVSDIAGPVDLVVIHRPADAVPPCIAKAAEKRVEAIWIPPGVWSAEIEAEARRHRLRLVKDSYIEREHQTLFESLEH